MRQVDCSPVKIGEYRQQIRKSYLADEYEVISELIAKAKISKNVRDAISARAADLVRRVRDHSKPSLMEDFLAQYGLTTKEGLALMCMAEALLRVPDNQTMDALIEDKVVSGNWGDHLGQSNSLLINSSMWALLITGKLIAPEEDKGLTNTLRAMLKRLGEPVVRSVVALAMKEFGRQFVQGRDIEEAFKKARIYESEGYTYSYDMLGEAARTDTDALGYLRTYSDAIAKLTPVCTHEDIRQNPGISVKLSALHARYEFGQHERVMTELVPRALTLAKQAKAGNMGFNIDAEEADRLDISLDVVEAMLSAPELEGWDGFGVVVQTFGQRASYTLDWLYALSVRLDRKIMVRLVKGAYWDAEIKRAQVMGLEGFPVFTRKASSDVSYIACAKKLLGMTDRIYPQFATHNAHSVSAILEMADGRDCFEFQRLHGMGESLYKVVLSDGKARCRIYAPVGAHEELLAYLVRRLLENGANSSFVNQIMDASIPPEEIAHDPFDAVQQLGRQLPSQAIVKPVELYGKSRRNSQGWDITNPIEVDAIEQGRQEFRSITWQGGPILAGKVDGTEIYKVYNPAIPSDFVGEVVQASEADIETAIVAAHKGFDSWSKLSAEERGICIRRVGELFERNVHELFALATREAGKTLLDGVAEIREAVDFALYYADEGVRNKTMGDARGVIACISPWNFPLAIFTGQVLASLAAGNTVIAKSAETTSLIATRAVQLMHEAGIPEEAIQFLPGTGAVVGAALTSDPRIAGVCFTGSIQTAQRINRAMAEGMEPSAPLVAETGGLNAMIVDSTALPEQVVRDVLASSFQSAGQRCSALRFLYVQKDIADDFLEMLFGAMDELKIGNPWELSTDVGPVIDQAAKSKIEAHCQKYSAMARVLKVLPVPDEGFFVAPTVIKLGGIEELEEEIFGPVLHVATFEADEIDQVVDAINNKGFGLTFGLHTRIDTRIERIINRVKVGNIYVNRNQIGAIVGSQPFGGQGLSGTGPKAGGPQYVRRFMQSEPYPLVAVTTSASVSADQLDDALNQLNINGWADADDRSKQLYELFGEVPLPLDATPEEMPGPTGELNRLTCRPRGTVLCLGPDLPSAMAQARLALSQGNAVVLVAPGAKMALQSAKAACIPAVGIDGLLQAQALESMSGFEAVASAADTETLREYRVALAKRVGALLPLITEQNAPERYVIERHLCVDTTAAGGNASLIAASE